jgi:hypothetical protein
MKTALLFAALFLCSFSVFAQSASTGSGSAVSAGSGIASFCGGPLLYCAAASLESEPLSQFPSRTINSVSVTGPALPAANAPYADPIFGAAAVRVSDTLDNTYCGKSGSYLQTFSSTEHNEISAYDSATSSYHFWVENDGNTPILFSVNPATLAVTNSAAPEFCMNSFAGGAWPNVRFGGDGMLEWLYGNPNEFIAATQLNQGSAANPWAINWYSFPSGQSINSTGSNLTLISTDNPNSSAALNGLLDTNPSYLTPPDPAYAITAASCVSNTVTATIGSNALFTGAFITVTSVSPSGYGVTDVALSGQTSTTISYPVSSCPGAYTSGGKVVRVYASLTGSGSAFPPSTNLWVWTALYDATTSQWSEPSANPVALATPATCGACEIAVIAPGGGASNCGVSGTTDTIEWAPFVAVGLEDNLAQQGSPIACATSSATLSAFSAGPPPQSCGTLGCTAAPDLFLSQDNKTWCTDTGYEQNAYWLIVCHNTTLGWLWMNTATGIISQGSGSTWPVGSTGTVTYTDGSGHTWTPSSMPANCASGVTLHNAVLSKGSNDAYYVDFGPQQGCFEWGTSGHIIKLEWQLGTTTVTVCGYTTSDCGGHHAQGATIQVNNEAGSSEYQFALRPNSTPNGPQQMISPAPASVNRWDSHPSWLWLGPTAGQNFGFIDVDDDVISADSTSQPTDQYPLEDEIWGIDPVTFVIHRFVHTYNVAYEGVAPLQDPCGGTNGGGTSFNTNELGTASADGKVYVYTSDFLGGGPSNANPPVLGCDPNTGSSGGQNARTDIFFVRLH